MYNLKCQTHRSGEYSGDYQELGGLGDAGQKGLSCSYVRWINSRDLMYSMMNMVNNTILNLEICHERFQVFSSFL